MRNDASIKPGAKRTTRKQTMVIIFWHDMRGKTIYWIIRLCCGGPVVPRYRLACLAHLNTRSLKQAVQQVVVSSWCLVVMIEEN